MAGEWIGAAAAAKILEVSVATVRRSLNDPDVRRKEWGRSGEGWRPKPLSRRPGAEYQLRRSWVVRKARGLPPAGDDPAP